MLQIRDENGKFFAEPRHDEEVQHGNIHLDHAYTSGSATACSQMRGMGDYPSDRETLSESESDSDTTSAFESDNESDLLDDNADESVPGIPLFGRHIVELQVLGNQLKKGCIMCGEKLQLSSCIGEGRYGLGSMLHIKCLACQKLNKIPTGKRRQNGVWDINSKLGAECRLR
ncbi:uncharacterized protein LOC134258539 [Saccostrea cucullata]|uniref:uncharacterized protein LOC134258539 n=1 Tax=Saccostrea cuccullata TaxID=36930 RepID=UPI002ED3B4EC